MLSTAAVAAALCSVAVAASTAGVAVHDPDGFGPHGRLATIGGLAWPSRSERAAVTGDSRIYVAAAPGPSDRPEAVRVRRYLPDGRPDPSFGLAGSVILSGPLGAGFRLDELLVDTNGMAYLVGTTGDGELVVARLDPSGALDPTYGDGGLVRLGPGPAGEARPRATIDQANRVLVAGLGVDGQGRVRPARSSVHLRGRGHATDVLLDPNGDEYVVRDREVIDLDIHPHARFCPGDTLDLFGRNGRVRLTSPGELVALGASITDSGSTLLVDGIARPRPGGPAHGFLARFPAAEHAITYSPETDLPCGPHMLRRPR